MANSQNTETIVFQQQTPSGHGDVGRRCVRADELLYLDFVVVDVGFLKEAPTMLAAVSLLVNGFVAAVPCCSEP